MSFGFNIGGSHSKQQGQSWIDPRTSDAQWANYGGAQSGLLANYSPTSASQINGYMSPYINDVIQPSLQALDQSRQMAINGIGDHAAGMHAFGGSRQGVAEGITNGQYAQQAGLLSANLYNQGYGQALGAAQQENQFGYQYPLQRQSLLNQTLAGITPHTYTKGSGTTFGGNIEASWGAPAGKG